MDGHNDSVMVALLPATSDWCKLELPHLTLVYAGHVEELSPTAHNEISKEALMLALACGPLSLDVNKLDVFGNEEDGYVDVFTLFPSPQLLAMRSIVEKWDASDYDYNPHVTIGPTGSYTGFTPGTIHFNQILVAWGGVHTAYELVGARN